MADELDLGSEHRLQFYGWNPSGARGEQSAEWPAVERLGALISHPDARDPEHRCEGSLVFDVPGSEHHAAPDDRWTVVSWEPLELAPSVLCPVCGDHGYVRAGRWEAA